MQQKSALLWHATPSPQGEEETQMIMCDCGSFAGGLFNCTSLLLVFQQVHPLPPLLIHPLMRDHPLLLIHEHSQVRKMIARVLTAFLSVLVNGDLNPTGCHNPEFI